MTKQQKYSIVMDMRNNYCVVLRGTSIAVYQSENHGQAGLEDCQDWLAHQPQEECPMPLREQLALIGESDTQMHFTSERWGLLTFFPSKSNKFKDTCSKCLLLHEAEECNLAHCYAEHRADGQNGYYSIHDMPDWAKKEKQ